MDDPAPFEEEDFILPNFDNFIGEAVAESISGSVAAEEPEAIETPSPEKGKKKAAPTMEFELPASVPRIHIGLNKIRDHEGASFIFLL